jgi:hypothetical protein
MIDLMPKRIGALVAFVIMMRVTPILAQAAADGGPDPARVRVRIGPLLMNPTIALTNLGIDQNVFNDPVDATPKKDFTFTVVPSTDIWLRMGRTWFTGLLKEEVIWYQKYANERSANNTYSVGWKVPLNRLNLSVGAAYRDVKERPGFEIDARARRKEIEYNGSAEFRGLSKTFFGVKASRVKENFANDALFLGVSLEAELNRVSTTTGAFVRHQLTPLTSIAVNAIRIQDRFEFSSLRNSNSTGVVAEIVFDPFALIKGNVSVGYRDFEPLAPGVPTYQGTTAAVNLSYTLLGSTKFSFGATRDVQYSYDVNEPYYLLTGFTGSISQQVFGPVDVVGRAGTQTMAYRDRAGAEGLVSNRVDRVRSYGAGIGYRLGKELRVGFNIDETRRISDVVQRQYNNLTFGTSVTYVY